MSIFDKWNQVQPKEVSGPQKGYMVLNKSRTQILSSPKGRTYSRETPYCCGNPYGVIRAGKSNPLTGNPRIKIEYSCGHGDRPFEIFSSKESSSKEG